MSDRLREAAQAVVSQAETDDDFDGQFIDYLVPFAAVDALRAALAEPSADTPADVYVGPIQHSNAQCQKGGCDCWCQACERHNWRHAQPADTPDRA